VSKLDDDPDTMRCTLHIGKETLAFRVDVVGDGDGRDVQFLDSRH
jgi:hypothetical protein